MGEQFEIWKLIVCKQLAELLAPQLDSELVVRPATTLAASAPVKEGTADRESMYGLFVIVVTVTFQAFKVRSKLR